MAREIVLDTETTGLSPQDGHRLVEIGCVELVNHVPTGRTHHVYLNPQRDMPDEAYRVHGLSEDFLRGKPLFSASAQAFLDFIGDGTLIIHNAPFDMGFLNAELSWLRRPALTNAVIDTVALARNVHPGARVSLDALCRHYGVDNSRRALHGALLDAQILAEVYLELIGGRQVALVLSAQDRFAADGIRVPRLPARARPVPLPPRLSADQAARHAAFVATLKEPLWERYLDDGERAPARAASC